MWKRLCSLSTFGAVLIVSVIQHALVPLLSSEIDHAIRHALAQPKSSNHTHPIAAFLKVEH